MIRYMGVITMVVALALGAGCETMQSGSATEKSTTGGVLLGAGLGAILGNNIHGLSSAEGAVAGALVGGLLGHSKGQQQDQLAAQQKELDQMTRAMNQTVIHVTNSNGSLTPVLLIKVGADQWRGPKGEIYTGLPTEAQLRTVYGMGTAPQVGSTTAPKAVGQPARATVQPSVAGMNRVVVHIKNSNGSLTPVILMKAGVNQWRGPRGEIYNGLPTEDQLKQVYGF
jgi:hypothetical protein